MRGFAVFAHASPATIVEPGEAFGVAGTRASINKNFLRKRWIAGSSPAMTM
jgi:hypothetical protein